MATQIEIQPRVSFHKEWHLYVAGDGVHLARAGKFAKFIPWSEVESVREHRITGRHGEPIYLPVRNRRAVLRHIRDEWQKHYPEACESDQRRARRQRLLIIYVGLPVFFILFMLLEFVDAERQLDSPLGEATKVVLTTLLHWVILAGLGLFALTWLVFWSAGLLRQHNSGPHETGRRDRDL